MSGNQMLDDIHGSNLMSMMPNGGKVGTKIFHDVMVVLLMILKNTRIILNKFSEEDCAAMWPGPGANIMV